MKKDVTELKKMVVEIMQNPHVAYQNTSYLNTLTELNNQETAIVPSIVTPSQPVMLPHDTMIHQHEEVEESLNIIDVEKELILKALKKHKGKRKDAATDLGISERTLYRKLKEYDINE